MKSLIVLSAFSLLLTCDPLVNPVVQQAGISGTPAPRSMEVLSAREVLDEVNALRAQGCTCPGGRRYAPAAPLRWDARLARAAQLHADDMYYNDYFSHNSADGTSFSDRITRAGYAWQAVGENIAKGQPTARAVVHAWANSKGHCMNMMNPGFEDMGVGKTGPYWVQDFGVGK